MPGKPLATTNAENKQTNPKTTTKHLLDAFCDLITVQGMFSYLVPT